MSARPDPRTSRRRPAPSHYLGRSRAIIATRSYLERKSHPRLQMSLMVALTGAAGALSSVLMLHLGLHNMALRYPLALLVAYGFFMFLLWLWLRTDASDYDNAPDAADLLSSITPRGGSAPETVFRSGSGGDFGGGGATGDWGVGSLASDSADAVGGVGKSLGAVAEADDLGPPLVAIALALVLVLGLAIAGCYLIYSAPVLLAEVAVDGALSYALYRRVGNEDPRHWLGTALRRTALPFILCAVLVAGIGWGLQAAAPEARSLGQAWKALSVEAKP